MSGECAKCGFEVEKGQGYCRSCFELVSKELTKVQKENERLIEKNKDLKNRNDVLKLEKIELEEKLKGKKRNNIDDTDLFNFRRRQRKGGGKKNWQRR